MQRILPKKDFPKFVDGLIKKYEVIAPVNTATTRFQKVDSAAEIFLDELTQFPIKSHFIPEGEKLLEFKGNKVSETSGQIERTILFGLRKCDLNAIQIIDKVMYDEPYLNKRRKTILVGFFCENPDKYCFCNSMQLEDYYDLFFYPKGSNYYISVGSDKGKALVSGLASPKKEVKIPSPRNFKRLKNINIAKNYKDSVWESDANRCLSCSACTVYCPTCNCFDVKDSSDMGSRNGSRKRTQASCQLKSFSRVAGGKSYRDSRLARFKHFVYHKIAYYKKLHNRSMCVGCGRCLRVCPAKIDWVETINKLPRKK